MLQQNSLSSSCSQAVKKLLKTCSYLLYKRIQGSIHMKIQGIHQEFSGSGVDLQYAVLWSPQKLPFCNRYMQWYPCITLNKRYPACRVEPTAASSVFLVHGKACKKTEAHPTCSHDEEGVEPLGKLYAIDFKELMGEDWRVRQTPYCWLPPCYLPRVLHCIPLLNTLNLFAELYVSIELDHNYAGIAGRASAFMIVLQICEDDQYEKFTLSPTPDRCLLGRNVTSTRRKPDSACFNGRGWQRPHGWDELCDCNWVNQATIPYLPQIYCLQNKVYQSVASNLLWKGLASDCAPRSSSHPFNSTHLLCPPDGRVWRFGPLDVVKPLFDTTCSHNKTFSILKICIVCSTSS